MAAIFETLKKLLVSVSQRIFFKIQIYAGPTAKYPFHYILRLCAKFKGCTSKGTIPSNMSPICPTIQPLPNAERTSAKCTSTISTISGESIPLRTF